jgi:SAM-dependent methyltransferase
VSFAVAADSYDRFIGRYSRPLAPVFADFAGVTSGQRVLDVGCGPGALTAELVRRGGPSTVSAVDPSEPFVAAASERYPDVDVRQAEAEHLPFDDRSFDAVLSQLVVHFMADPVQGLREMARVTAAGGVVAACVWDHAGGSGPLSTFWEAARELDPDVDDESQRAGTRQGHLMQLLGEAGARRLEEDHLWVTVAFDGFDEWWAPFTLGVGPAGAYATGLDPDQLAALRARCRTRFPDGSFDVTVGAWAARGFA